MDLFRMEFNVFFFLQIAMAWSMSVWVLTVTATVVAAGPLQIPTSMCIPQGSYCMDTVKPCCQPAVLEGFHVRHHERICFIFGQGLCQPFYEIPKIQLYVKLVKKLNSTNYMELRRAYRRELDVDPHAELVDPRLLRSPISDSPVTTIFIDSRLISSQMDRNNAATNFTDSNAIPTQMVRNDTATNLTDSNVISTQMVRNDTATNSTDSNVIPTQMVRNDTVRTIIPVQKSGKKIMEKMNAIPDTPMQWMPADKLRKVGVFPAISSQTTGKDISIGKVIYYPPSSKLPESKKLSSKLLPQTWMRYKCIGRDCDTD
ncbi:cysteine motif protein 2 [Diadegma fenestrale ichnovirus]|nr:cysteine motif protein 2 [Diadegma fenestrale ichnovirus]